jgi:ankyrin repeat protein
MDTPCGTEQQKEALEILWGWAVKAQLNTDELLLAQNVRGKTALRIAAQGNHVEILQKLWLWAKEAQSNSNELMNKLLLAENKDGYTVWHRAAERDRLVVLETWSWAEKAQLNQVELLLSQNEEETPTGK